MNTAFSILAISATAFVASGCVIVAGDFDDDSHVPRAGDIMGSVVDSRGVTVTARSNGCTDKSYYAVDIDRDDGRYEISFDRVREDHCRALLRDGVELNWSYSELGIPEGAPVIIKTRSKS